MIYSFCVFFVNMNLDSSFAKFLMTPIMSLSAALILCKAIGNRLTLGLLVDYILCVALIQAIISFALFLNPILYDSVMSLIQFDDVYKERVLGLVEYRLIGIGNSIWLAGANYGVDLLLLMSLPNIDGSFFYRNKFLYYVSFFFIILAGILSARTFFSIFLIIGIYLYMVKSSNLKFAGMMVKFLLFLVIVFITLYNIASQYIDMDRFEEITSWAFEAFFSYNDTGVVSTGSSDRIIEMYKSVPDNITGWIIGEGHFENPDGSYYKHTDIGYLRLILCFGIIGLLFYLLAIYKFYKETSKLFCKGGRELVICLYIFELILLSKGIISLSLYISLFYVTGVLCNRKKYGYKRTTNEVSVHNCTVL